MQILKNHSRKYIYILVGILTVLLCTGCTDREEKQLEFRQQGINLMQNGDYEEALEAFQSALDLSLGEVGETEMDICFYKAEALYHLNDIKGAWNTYTAIISFNENPKAYFLRGNLYYSRNQEEKALKDYAAAIEQEKKDYDLYIGVYEALMAHDREKEAQEYLNQALEIKGNSAYDKMQKGRINFLLGEEETAVSLLKEAIKGKEVTAYYYLAEIYSLSGDSKSSEETMAAYMESGKADAYNLLNMANDLIEKENYDMAIECLNMALSLEKVPNKQMLMKTLVIAYEQNLDFASAKKVMTDYMEAYPDDEEAKREFTFLETR